MITKATEYQMVAALLAMDIDVIARAAEANPDNALKHLQALKERKDKIISDKEYREMRYASTCSLFSSLHPSTETSEASQPGGKTE